VVLPCPAVIARDAPTTIGALGVAAPRMGRAAMVCCTAPAVTPTCEQDAEATCACGGASTTHPGGNGDREPVRRGEMVVTRAPALAGEATRPPPAVMANGGEAVRTTHPGGTGDREPVRRGEMVVTRAPALAGEATRPPPAVMANGGEAVRAYDVAVATINAAELDAARTRGLAAAADALAVRSTGMEHLGDGTGGTDETAPPHPAR